MPVGNARKTKVLTVIRVSQRVALAATVTIISANNLNTATANGDTRTITMHHTHRGDDITVTFKRNGRYDDDSLKKLNYFLRDWRTDDATTMDPQLFDAVWEVAREFGTDKQINIISSYRSPRTNAMLRGRSGSSGVARHSLHMQGKALDFFIPGVPLDKIREAGLRLQRGGVGFYPTSGSPFVHMDVGNVRHWPRMTRDQLARVFPNGRTVHLPTDGKPLAGFALAQAEVEKRGSSPSAYEAARIASADTKKPNVLTRLFSSLSKKKPSEEENDTETPLPAAKPIQVASAGAQANLVAGLDATKLQPAPASAATIVAAAQVPMPKSRPAGAGRQTVAAAKPAPVEPTEVSATSTLAAAGTPNDIILSRGYWQGLPESPTENSAAQRGGAKLASANTSTGSIGPFAAPLGYGEDKHGQASLSYASFHEPETEPAPRRAKSPAIPRAAAIAANTTIASKARPNVPTEVHSAPAMVTDAREIEQRRWDGPWMRALIMTPSVERFMNTTLYGSQDFLSLQPLLQKPTEMVLMAFALEPTSNLTHVRFEGRAIEFIATATFTPRTADAR